MAVLSSSGPKRSQVTIDAISEETDTIVVRAGETLSLSIDGSYTGTIQLQRSFDGTNWKAVEDYAATGATNSQKDIIAAVNAFWRVISTAWTSGTGATVILASSG